MLTVLGTRVVSRLRGVDLSATVLVAACCGLGLGLLLQQRLNSSSGMAPTAVLRLGRMLILLGLSLRLAAFVDGSPNSVSFLGRSLVIGELSAVVLVVGTGALLRVASRAPRPRPAVLEIVTVVVVATALGARDLGPTVLFLIAVLVMTLLTFRSVVPGLLLGLLAAGSAVAVLAFVPIARARLSELTNGGYQTLAARDAVGAGGLLWGGGERNGLAAAIPVAESDHLAAYLAATWGVVPFAALLALTLVALALLTRSVVSSSSPTRTESLGLLMMGSAQMVWSALASAATVLPLSGIPLPFVGVSGSSTFSWWLATGVVLGTVLRRPEVAVGQRPRPAIRVREIALVAAVTVCAVVAPSITVVSGAIGVLSPSSSILTGGFSTNAQRGAILSMQGDVLAESINGERVSTLGSGAVEAVGLISPGYNLYGLEAAASGFTTCGDTTATALAGLVGPRCRPADVVSTLDIGLQEEAVRLSKQVPGTDVLVLSLEDLGVVAAYSTPPTGERPDPAAFADGTLSAEEYSPLLSSSPFFPGVFAAPISPGSLFKVPVLAVAIENGTWGEDGADPPPIPDDLGLVNAWDGPCPAPGVDAAIAYSCNDVTAASVRAMGQPALADGLERWFGIGSGTRTLDGRPTGSGGTGLDDGPLAPAALSRTAVGLEGVQLPMLELGSVIAHAVGAPPETTPHLLAGICTGNGSTVPTSLSGAPVGNALSPTTVALIREGMAEAVRSGTAESLLTGIEIPSGTTVLAKTGTPDHLVGDVVVRDSLSVVVIDDLLILTRVAGSPDRPRPDLESRALDVAREMMISSLQTNRDDRADPCRGSSR